jgi:predicted ATP-dependent endonuclease of OLD family
MQLAHVRVKNFRSLKNVSVQLGSHTALIGANGAGKSSILKAIERFYSTARSLDADDFFGRDQSVAIEIELTFNALTPAEVAAFESRVRDGQLVVTRIFDGTPGSGRYHGAVLQNADFIPIRAQSQANPKRAAYNELRTTNPGYSDLPAAGSAAAVDAALTAWEESHPEALTLHLDDGQFFGFQNASRGALQKYTTFVFVPAVREASVDAADAKSSAIGRLLELVVRSSILQRQDILQFKEEMTARYQTLVSAENMPELGLLATRLTADLQNLYQEAEVGLSWREVGEFPVPLPTADVSLSDDGFGGPVDRQGHGLQRAFVFTLLQHLARTSTVDSQVEQAESGQEQAEPSHPQAPNLMLAIEEPELYQHPIKQRHLSEVLRQLSNGTLPGTDAPTQIAFATHSPMFVSVGHAAEIRMVRRTDCEESEFKQCELNSLDLSRVARRLEPAWGKPEGSYSAEALVPRLHILGTELAEGFFASGVVLVEGRSDKAALTAAAQVLGLNFEAAGIAVLSAEGKENLDRPLVILKELGIPTFVVWDCDSHKAGEGAKPATNLALVRLATDDNTIAEPPSDTAIGATYAHFSETLERTMRQEIGESLNEYLAAACEPVGIAPSKDAQKIPEIMRKTLAAAQAGGSECPTLSATVQALWLHLRGEHVPPVEEEPSPDEAEEMSSSAAATGGSF